MKYFERVRAVLRNLVQAPRPATPVRADERDVPKAPAGIGAEPASWLAAFETAVERGTLVSSEALALIKEHVGRYPAEAFFTTDRESQRLLAFLRPRAGLS